ncbi:hypothetical protein CLOM_g6033 [Closterium sp. NIES-68]|nr:hypothetical protein CLOM_g6033 [Closterium sp. NIES-68]
MAEEPMARRLPARSTRGKWSSKRAEEDVERDKAFWEQSLFQEEEEDADFDVSKEVWGGSGSAGEQGGGGEAEQKEVGEEEEGNKVESGEEEEDDDVQEMEGEEGGEGAHDDGGRVDLGGEQGGGGKETQGTVGCGEEAEGKVEQQEGKRKDMTGAQGADAGWGTTKDVRGEGSTEGEGEGKKRKDGASSKTSSNKRAR